MRICVIGAGYVGLATSVMFGKLGHEVVCCDVDEARVKMVRNGKLPFYEPPLEKELSRLVRPGRLAASDDAEASARSSDFIFLCVQTPSRSSGRIDLRPMTSACRSLGRALRASGGFRIVVVKSTVVPTTTDSIIIPTLERASGKRAGKDFGVCVNPEFLQEGSALKDSMQPSRIIVGSDDKKSGMRLMRLYAPIKCKKIATDVRSAEMIKYASNSALAARITYANEIANMCLRLGIDSQEVLSAVGLDPRIGPLFLQPGLGFGGSCLPKDVRALRRKAKEMGYDSKLLGTVLAVNEYQPTEGIMLLENAVGDLRGKRIAVLGLAFKGGVDDVRDTRAVPLITGLLSRGAKVVAYDPLATSSFIRLMPTISYAESAGQCLDGADGCIIQADWPEFRTLSKKEFSKMRIPVVVDGRRCLDPERVTRSGARYMGIGYGHGAE